MPARRDAALPAENPDPVALSAALTVENVSLGAFAAMTALIRAGGTMRLMKLSIHVGQSYWAMRNNIRRTPYFEYENLPEEKLMVRITAEGREKTGRVLRRVAAFNHWESH